MSQHDFVIANQTASSARTDINNALQALASCNSGTSAPTTTYANMFWYETDTNILKMRNEADDAWINLLYVDQTNNLVHILDDTEVANTSGTQTGLIGGQAQSTWNTGTGTTESLISPAVLDAKIANKTSGKTSTPTSGITQFPVGSYTIHYAGGFSASAALFDVIDASTNNFTVMDVSSGNYVQNTINYGTWMYMGRIYGVSGALVCRIT